MLTGGWILFVHQLESEVREKFEVVSVSREQSRVLLDGVGGDEAIGGRGAPAACGGQRRMSSNASKTRFVSFLLQILLDAVGQGQ